MTNLVLFSRPFTHPNTPYHVLVPESLKTYFYGAQIKDLSKNEFTWPLKCNSLIWADAKSVLFAPWHLTDIFIVQYEWPDLTHSLHKNVQNVICKVYFQIIIYGVPSWVLVMMRFFSLTSILWRHKIHKFRCEKAKNAVK